jgi:hypothetical protein
MTKFCSICKEEKDIYCFSKDKHNKDGLCVRCKECSKKYWSETKEKRHQKQKLYRESHSQEIKETKIKCYKNNKTKYDKTRKNYLINNKEKIKLQAKLYQRERRKNPLYRSLDSLRHRLYMCLKKNRASFKTLDLLGCSLEDFRFYMESKFSEGMSWDNYGEWHIDHIKPCVSFDLTDDTQVKLCFHYSNLQPLWALDNILKKDKLL